jgi:transcriptional regulator with PAS, ATPase and Fis domain
MFRLAHGGTIFLTEIGDLPLPLQVKLLTVLDDREFFPLGSTKKVKVDVRVIAATHRDLREYVAQGRFREDLFYRLNVLRLHLPPLRERQGDIRVLLDHFLSIFSANLNKSIKKFDEPATELLLRYPYPGNVRELRNIIEHAAIICREQVIGTVHLPDFVRNFEQQPAPLERLRPGDFQPAARGGWGADSGAATPGPPTNVWGEVEKKMIIDALIKTGGKRSRAAKMLGWGRSTLWRKIREHNLT